MSDIAPQEFLHVECDCVPDLGPSHCHLCSMGDHVIQWPCAYADAMAEHDREVAEKAWERAEFAFERAHNADMLEPWGHMPDNPYRGTPEQEGKG